MKWITNCLASLYSSSCTNEVSTTTVLPSTNPEPLSPIIPIDCKGCSKPCAHPNVPPHLNIDQSKPLKNTVPPYSIHIIIMTGKSDWPAHIEDEGLAGAFIEAIRKRKENDKIRPPESSYHPAFYASSEKDDCHRIIVTNASLPSKYSYQHKGTDVLLLPDNVIFSNITPRRVNALLDYIFGKPCSQAFSVYPCPYSSLVLVCGHGNKDRRCGTIGPMLQKSLQQAASQDEEGNHVQIALSSHLGGHAFAGNVVIYTHHGQRAIWYGRVTPCYCKDIVDNTLEDNKVIEDLVRGIFEVRSKPSKCHKALEW